MKNNEEFRKDVYERLEKYNEKKAQRKRNFVRFGSTAAAALVLAAIVAFPMTRLSMNNSTATKGREGDEVIAAYNVDGNKQNEGVGGAPTKVLSNVEDTAAIVPTTAVAPTTDEPNTKAGGEALSTEAANDPKIDATAMASVRSTTNATPSDTEGPAINNEPRNDEPFYTVVRTSDYSKFVIPSYNTRLAVNYGITYSTQQGNIVQWDAIVKTSEELDEIMKEHNDKSVYYANSLAVSGECDYYFVIAVSGEGVSSTKNAGISHYNLNVSEKDSDKVTVCVFGIDGSAETDIVLW